VKTVREWKIELPKIKDVTIVEKALEEELALEKPRKGVIEILKDKIDLLTIKPSESDSKEVKVEDADVVTSKEVEVKQEPIQAVVLHKEQDILLILRPYQDKLVGIKITELTWKDTSDKIGYQNIKNNLKSLSELRRTVDAERTTFTEPYRDVVSFANDNCSSLIGDIKDLESILKDRKTAFDNQKAKEKEEASQKKAAELAEKQLKEEQKISDAKESDDGFVQSNSFQEKFGGIIGRAQSNLNPKEEIIDDSPFGEETKPKDLFDTTVLHEEVKPIVLTDKQILQTKLQLLEKIIDMDIPDSEFFMTPCKIIDDNVQKIINHIKSKFGV
jgi:hypothetical protein